jgi:LmbE family N-acetylglucosaminyl deacetylase
MPHCLACVFAHPDDETFGAGGTIARYALEGVATALYCATDGDAGKSSGLDVATPAALGELRRAELKAAAKVLGFRTLTFGGYADGKLGTVDADLLVDHVIDFLREHRPTVVVTFGPEGAPNAHRDHRAISRATTAAFFLAGSPTARGARGLVPYRPARLYYTSWTPPGTGARFPVQAVPATASVDVRVFVDAKRRAFDAHASQHVHRESFEASVTDHELFALAAGVAQPEPMTDDLFAGLPE